MIREKVAKLTEYKYFNVITIAVINIVFFIICNNLFVLKYEQVDDFMIMNLISKMDGIYNIYGVQMHPLICGIIILLFKTGVNINWYTIFLLSMQFISFTIIGTVLAKKHKTIGITLYTAFMFMIYSKVLCYIQYTTVSMLCITSGFILLIHSIDDIKNIKKVNFCIAILMVLLGTLIRFSTVIIAIPFISIYFMCKFLKQKDIKIVKIFFILIILILLINISFNVIYNINPIYKEFLKFHDVRTYFHDYNWLNYYENIEVFDSANWSKNDRDMLYAYCFGDEEVFNTEELEKLKENISNNAESTNILEKCENTLKSLLGSILKDKNYMYLFLLTLILMLANNLYIINKGYKDEESKKEYNIKLLFCNLTFFAILGMHFLFIYLERPMLRVIVSIYTIGIAILMYYLLENVKFNKIIEKYIFIFFILLISIFELRQNVIIAKKYNIDNYSVYKEAIEYANSHKEDAYLYTLSMRDRFLAYSIYEKIPDDTFSNIRPLGDWDTYTKNYYDFKQRYDIENLITSLYEKDNVYLISGNLIWSDSYGSYLNIVINYIKEHYNINVQAEIVKEFENNIKIYKLIKK